MLERIEAAVAVTQWHRHVSNVRIGSHRCSNSSPPPDAKTPLVFLGADTAPSNKAGWVTGPSMLGTDEAAEAVTEDSEARPRANR